MHWWSKEPRSMPLDFKTKYTTIIVLTYMAQILTQTSTCNHLMAIFYVSPSLQKHPIFLHLFWTGVSSQNQAKLFKSHLSWRSHHINSFYLRSFSTTDPISVVFLFKLLKGKVSDTPQLLSCNNQKQQTNNTLSICFWLQKNAEAHQVINKAFKFDAAVSSVWHDICNILPLGQATGEQHIQ